jgi:hypothetical protein
MARNTSVAFKFQGTIDGLTHVNSNRYPPHVRAKKYSKTPFVMTDALAESKARLQLCNQYTKPVFQAIRTEAYDGDMWSRMVSLQFAELKAGRPLGLECLKGFDCNLQYKLSELITGGYDFSATVTQNQLGIYVQLHDHPKVADVMPRTGYQLRFVAIVPDAANGTVYKQVALGPLTRYDSELTAVDVPIALPAGGGPCMLLMGIVPHLQKEGACKIMSDSGMKVVWVGDCEEVISEMPITGVERLVGGLEGDDELGEIAVEAVGIASDDKESKVETIADCGSAERTAVAQDKESQVESTEEAKEGFMIVKAILRQKIKPDRIMARKEPSCLAVLLDGDERKTVCRLYLGGPKRYIGIIGEGQEEIKIEIGSVDDLFEYGELLLKTVEGYEGELTE